MSSITNAWPALSEFKLDTDVPLGRLLQRTSIVAECSHTPDHDQRIVGLFWTLFERHRRRFHSYRLPDDPSRRLNVAFSWFRCISDICQFNVSFQSWKVQPGVHVALHGNMHFSGGISTCIPTAKDKFSTYQVSLQDICPLSVVGTDVFTTIKGVFRKWTTLSNTELAPYISELSYANTRF